MSTTCSESEYSQTTFNSDSNSYSYKQKSPHGDISFRKLLSMKIVDKSSCYVTGIPKYIASREILKNPEYFGQFGEVLSVRFIKNSNPICAHLRLQNENSAKAAILWCQKGTNFITADHGYHRYCRKFVNHKQCRNPDCQNRHMWCEANDFIISKNQTYRACDQNSIPFFQSNRKRIDPHRPVTYSQMRELQTHIDSLQTQYKQQNKFIESVMHKMHQLSTENQLLKRRFNDYGIEADININSYYNNYRLQTQQNRRVKSQMEINAIVDSIIRDDTCR